MNPYVFPQVPLPEQKRFNHNHNCIRCDTWTTLGTITYSDDLEKTVFFCKDCTSFCSFKQLPRKIEFTHWHECIECFKSWRSGVITYCSRCEEGDFVCPLCLVKWLEKIIPDEYYDSTSKLI